MKTVKINAKGAGKWADPNTNIPQIEVEEGDIVEVSDELAGLICNNCGSIIEPEAESEDGDVVAKEEEPKPETVITTGKEKPAIKDKKAATRKPAAKDKGKAESK